MSGDDKNGRVLVDTSLTLYTGLNSPGEIRWVYLSEVAGLHSRNRDAV